MKNVLTSIVSGICAGVCISAGGAVFLGCENKIAGAVLFCVALLCICMKGYGLFTGKVGYIAVSHQKADWQALLFILLGNTVGTVAAGLLFRWAVPASGQTALAVCTAKLSQTTLQTLIRGFFCGILMYLAVSIFREKNTPSAIFFCIPAFILSGFEHSIADIFYFAASGIVSLQAFFYLWLVIIGNSLGGVLLPVLEKCFKK